MYMYNSYIYICVYIYICILSLNFHRLQVGGGTTKNDLNHDAAWYQLV